MICRSDIASLKTDIGDMIGQKIIVKGSLGRSKTFEKEGTIEKAYPNIFVVKYEENERNVTYSYTDVLTRTVQVDVFDGQNYSPLIPPIALLFLTITSKSSPISLNLCLLSSYVVATLTLDGSLIINIVA